MEIHPRTEAVAELSSTIVCICGSTRFRAEMAEANRELTLAGCIVLAPGVFAHDGDEITEAEKQSLDQLHLRKIDLADEVLVVDPGGYGGESTSREIAYAREKGKPLYFLSTGGRPMSARLLTNADLGIPDDALTTVRDEDCPGCDFPEMSRCWSDFPPRPGTQVVQFCRRCGHRVEGIVRVPEGDQTHDRPAEELEQ